MTRDRAATDFLVVYCAATPPSKDIGAREIDRRHRALGQLCIGHHWVIRRSGAVEAGRDERTVGAHDPALNAVSVAVCLVGGVAADEKTPENNFTEAQTESLTQLLAQLGERYPNAVTIYGRNHPAKET